MTDLPELGGVIEQFEFALVERLQRFEMTDDQLREEFDLPPDEDIVRIDLLAIDTVRIAQIAWYLINEEELALDFLNPDERERVVSIGMFIYAWEESKLIANEPE